MRGPSHVTPPPVVVRTLTIAGTDALEIVHPDHLGDISDPAVSGDRCRRAAEEYGALQLEVALERGLRLGERALVVGIPRGGYPCAAGVSRILTGRGMAHDLLFSNAGEWATGAVGKLTIEPEPYTGIVIADFVIGSGWELAAHARSLRSQLAPGWAGAMLVLAGVASVVGLQQVIQVAARLPGVELAVTAGKVYQEPECRGYTWIDGRMVYVVGVGDAGQKVQGELTREELVARYQPTIVGGERIAATK